MEPTNMMKNMRDRQEKSTIIYIKSNVKLFLYSINPTRLANKEST